MFFGGVTQALLAMLWWLLDIGARFTALYPAFAWPVSPVDAHAFLMMFGIFPFFIFGFLMTVYPRWMSGEEVARKHYLPSFLLLAAGALLFYVGLLSNIMVLAFALLLFLAGWAIGLYALLRVYRHAAHPDKRHVRITNIVLSLGWLLMVILLAGWLTGHPALVAFAKAGGIWLLLLPVFFAVSHRMIPFFSSTALKGYVIVRPDWTLAVFPIFAVLHLVLEIAGLPAWLWLVDLPMMAIAFYLSYAWRFSSSLNLPLLAMLHVGFLWLGIAMALFTLQSLALALYGMAVLGKGPLHALVIGFFTSMLLGMATRVTLGHSGRTLVVDRLIWNLFLVFQLIPLLRIAADLPGITPAVRGHIYLCAAVLWLTCFAIWYARFAPVYCRPRADGKPG